MILRKQHLGPTVPVSLSGVATLRIALPATCTTVEIGAALYSHPNALLHFRISTDAELPATTLGNEECAMTHFGVQPINLNPRNQYYLYVLLTDSDGANLPGGDNDRVIILAEREVIR